MVNNAEQIRSMLSFNEMDFYFVQILKRRKDNPDLARDMVVIDNYYIESFEQFDSAVPHMIRVCDMENARAYFRLNKRNYKHLSYHMLKRVVDHISSGMYKSLKNSFDKVVGEYHNDKDKTWVVDIDWVDFGVENTLIPNIYGYLNLNGNRFAELMSTVQGLQLETKREPMMVVLKTKNGFHIITRPFNLQKFKVKFPNVDVHKDNPVLLYCP